MKFNYCMHFKLFTRLCEICGLLLRVEFNIVLFKNYYIYLYKYVYLYNVYFLLYNT